MQSSTPSSPAIAWSDMLLTGHGPMDLEHREFVALVQDLQACGDEQFAARLQAFEAHASSHFGAEDRWMTESDYAKGECHAAEHHAVLQSVAQVRDLLARDAAGALAVGRRLADELALWFPAHVQHLDSALAHWVSQRATGGKPVVLRRGALASTSRA